MSVADKYLSLLTENKEVEIDIQPLISTLKSYKKAVLYFHQDLDGVASAIAMKYFLLSIKGPTVVNAISIQYGQDLHSTPKYDDPHIANIMVDFSKHKINTQVWVDHHHHDDDEYVDPKIISVDISKSKSAAEKINGYIIKNDDISLKGFSEKDINVISMIDSASYSDGDWTPEELATVMAEIEKRPNRLPEEVYGTALSEVINAYKNKGFFLSDLVLYGEPSLKALYELAVELVDSFATARIKYAEKLKSIKNIKDEEFEEWYEKYFPPKIEDIEKAKTERKTTGGGSDAQGAYNRYVGIKSEDYIIKEFSSIGMIQFSKNPFKSKNNTNPDKKFESPDLNLQEIGDAIVDRLYNEYDDTISLYDLKLFAETKNKEYYFAKKMMEVTDKSETDYTEAHRMLSEIYDDPDLIASKLSAMGFNTGAKPFQYDRPPKKDKNGNYIDMHNLCNKLTEMGKFGPSYKNLYDKLELIIKGIERELFIIKRNKKPIVDSEKHDIVNHLKKIQKRLQKFIDISSEDVDKEFDFKDICHDFDGKYPLTSYSIYDRDIFGLTGSDIFKQKDLASNDYYYIKDNGRVMPINKNYRALFSYILNNYTIKKLENMKKYPLINNSNHPLKNKVTEGFFAHLINVPIEKYIGMLKQTHIKKMIWVKNQTGGHTSIYNITGLDIFGYGYNKVYKKAINMLNEEFKKHNIPEEKIYHYIQRSYHKK